jgi:transcriptional regulator with XRE-family HTH domain
MTALAEIIRGWRGTDNYVKFSKRAGINRQTLKELEEGISVKLETLQRIAKNCKLSEAEWTDMLIAWIRTEIGEAQFNKVDIRPAPSAATVKKLKAANELFLSRFHRLTNAGKAQILKAMMRTEVMSCLPPINAVWERGQDLNQVLEHEAPQTWQDLADEIGKLEESKKAPNRGGAKTSRRRPQL